MGTAIIRYGDKGDLAPALLKEHVPGAQLVKDTRSSATVDLVLGNAYSALTRRRTCPRSRRDPSRGSRQWPVRASELTAGRYR